MVESSGAVGEVPEDANPRKFTYSIFASHRFLDYRDFLDNLQCFFVFVLLHYHHFYSIHSS
jgi:hypothetical protein